MRGSGQGDFSATKIGGGDYGRNPYGGWANVVWAFLIETGSITMSVNASAGTFTRASGSFLTDGFEAGMSVITTGFTNGGNNNNFVISSVTATVITVTDNTGLVNETSTSGTWFRHADYVVGSPTTAQQYFGSGLLPAGAVSKGEMHCVDEIAYGRGELKIEHGDLSNGYGTFAGLATENDKNTTGAYNRWGLFKDEGKFYLWKGLMSFGNATNSCDFRDSTRSVYIDDTPRAYKAFNRIEFNNTSSRVDWTDIKFESLNESGLSIGQLEMIDNIDLNIDTCVFTGMDTFVFLSNATILDSIFRRCQQVTHGGADFDNCTFDDYKGATGTGALLYNVNADPDGEIDDCNFTKGDGTTHAIQFGTNTPTTITLRGIDFAGYNASNGQSDSTLYFPDKESDTTWTVNLVGCSGNISYYKARSGDTINLVINPVALTITVKHSETKSAIEGAPVTIWAKTGGPLPFEASVSITRSGSVATVSHTAHGLSTGQKVEIFGADQNEYNRIKTITKINDNSYSYTVQGTPATPATGTIKATAVIIDEKTNASGVVSDTRSYSANQGYQGKAQKGTSSPVYKDGSADGTIDKDNGASATIFLVPDD